LKSLYETSTAFSVQILALSKLFVWWKRQSSSKLRLSSSENGLQHIKRRKKSSYFVTYIVLCTNAFEI